ncbi:MAG: phosphatidate cytidylyltransferase [Clostridiaceae bacterium]|nr:phosphatidate cytidylyltransferase [Clostridiaceae bacterium]
MLKIRIASALIGLSLLLAAVLISKETLVAAVLVLSVAAVHEFYNAVSKAGYKPARWVGYLSSVIVLITGFTEGKDLLFIAVAIIMVIIFSLPVFFRKKYNTADIAMTIYGIFLTVFMFLFIILIRELKDGVYHVWIVFIGAWATDTFAYFGGITLGKRKLIPSISPNKTVEGAISGVIGAVAAIALYGFLIGQRISHVPYYNYIIMGMLCGIISQVGDLAASAIKRNTGIKDYGSIMPGHGGILDRFDSVLLLCPLIYAYLYFLL